MINNGTHFSAIGESPNAALQIPAAATGSNSVLARDYVRALSVAFFKTYIVGQPSYRSYLSANYAEAISQTSLSLSLVRSLTAARLERAIDSRQSRID